MDLIAALQHQGNPFWIPDCTRDDLPKLYHHLGFKAGAEVGVSWAQNLVNYCQAGFTMYGIDPWKDSDDNVYRKIISIEGKYSKTIDDVYKYARERTAPYPNCTLIRKTSVEAAGDFADRSLDFVYIDANHAFGYVAMDLMIWSRKVKKGGVIAGHDYYSTQRDRQLRHVGNVVDAFARSYDFTHWYVLGRKNEDRVEGERFDRELSYLFIKHW